MWSPQDPVAALAGKGVYMYVRTSVAAALSTESLLPSCYTSGPNIDRATRTRVGAAIVELELARATTRLASLALVHSTYYKVHRTSYHDRTHLYR